MDTTITRNVQEIAADDRRALESLLGSPLAADQQVFILAYTPGEPPDDSARARARARLEQRLTSNQLYADQQGISSEDADAAIAEAMEQARRRA